MDIGDEIVVLATDRLARICDCNRTGYVIQYFGSDAKAFVRTKEVRRAERCDIIRLQARQRQEFLMPGKRELDPIQAMLAAKTKTPTAAQAPAHDPIERYLRDEA